MTGMEMHHHAGCGGLPKYLGMWMAMMVPMMLPSLVPMLLGYRRSVQGAVGMRLHELTALVSVGYYTVWAVIGVAAWAASAGVVAAEMRWGWVGEWLPAATGVVLLVAGGVQLSSWKTRQLADCREGSGCVGPRETSSVGAWRHGLRMGVQCSLCCGNLMLALLVIGMMNVVAVPAVTLAIAAERMAAAPARMVRVAGVAVAGLGVLISARAGPVPLSMLPRARSSTPAPSAPKAPRPANPRVALPGTSRHSSSPQMGQPHSCLKALGASCLKTLGLAHQIVL